MQKGGEIEKELRGRKKDQGDVSRKYAVYERKIKEKVRCDVWYVVSRYVPFMSGRDIAWCSDGRGEEERRNADDPLPSGNQASRE